MSRKRVGELSLIPTVWSYCSSFICSKIKTREQLYDVSNYIGRGIFNRQVIDGWLLYVCTTRKGVGMQFTVNYTRFIQQVIFGYSHIWYLNTFEVFLLYIFVLVREWSDSMWKILKEAVPAIWESNGRMGKLPSTTMFVSGNLTLSDIEKKIPAPMRLVHWTLYSLLFTMMFVSFWLL